MTPAPPDALEATESPTPRATPLARSLPPVYGAALLRLAFPALLLPLMATRLGAEEFGRLGLLLVWAGLLSTLVEGGFLAAATRRAVLTDNAGRWRLAQQVFSARVVLSAAVFALAAGVAVWLLRPAPTPDLLLAALLLGTAACALGWQATWYLQATQQLHRWAWVEMAVYGLWALAVLVLGHSVVAYLGLQTLAMAALAGLGWRWLGRDLREWRSPGGPHDTSGRRDVTRLWARGEVRAGLGLGASMLPVSLAGAVYSQALPAVAAAQMSRSDLGTYFLADRLVRAVLAAADPVFQVVYPRIVAQLRQGLRAALAYSAQLAALGALTGLLLLATGVLAWPLVQHLLTDNGSNGRGNGGGGIPAVTLAPVLATLGLLLPILLSWKFIGYWMLGSARFDHAYRACVVAGGVAGVVGAWWWGGQGPLALARVAVGVELIVIATAVVGIVLTRRHGRAAGR